MALSLRFNQISWIEQMNGDYAPFKTAPFFTPSSILVCRLLIIFSAKSMSVSAGKGKHL